MWQEQFLPGGLQAMAHIHLEDGSFTLFWAAVWWAVALAIIGLALFRLRLWKKTDSHRITVAAFCTAAIFAIFLVEIPVAGGIHLNMTPLAGILTGPFSGCLIVFVVNILSAAVGHGGWSMIGANTLVNAAEAVVAFAIFRLLAKITAGPFFPAAVATFTGLLCGNAIMVALILVSGIQGVTQSPDQMLAALSLVIAINLAVAVIESVITGFMVAFLCRVRPDILNLKTKQVT